jgi:hypothetical protein
MRCPLVGVLVEVPVMLSVIHIVRRSRGWYEQGHQPAEVVFASRSVNLFITRPDRV